MANTNDYFPTLNYQWHNNRLHVEAKGLSSITGLARATPKTLVFTLEKLNTATVQQSATTVLWTDSYLKTTNYTVVAQGLQCNNAILSDDINSQNTV